MIYGFVTFERMTYNNYVFPLWCDVIGNVANGITVMSMLVFAAYKMYKTCRRKKPFMSVFKPAATWVPLRLKDRVLTSMVVFKERYRKYDHDHEKYEWPVADKKSKEKDKNKATVRQLS